VDGKIGRTDSRIERFDPDGTKQVIADRLFFPTGITIGPDGNLYVSDNGFGPPGLGNILKIVPPAD
jgi:hypothetical protein